MVEFTAATATSQLNPAFDAMLNRKNLPTKPDYGGIPARPNSAIIIASAMDGLVLERPR